MDAIYTLVATMCMASAKVCMCMGCDDIAISTVTLITVQLQDWLDRAIILTRGERLGTRLARLTLP